MFKFLRQFLFPTKQVEQIEQTEEVSKEISKETKEDNIVTKIEKDYLCSLSLQLNYDGTVNIICYWPNFEKLEPSSIDDIASQYATMIFMVNNGLLKKDIVETLSDVLGSDEPFDAYFVHQVLEKWLEITEKTEKVINSKPFIKPSSVFKNYMNK
jgi:hypothetical protein